MHSEPTILFADNHLLIVVKPAGLPSQRDHSGDPSLVDWAKGYLKTTYGKPGEVYVGLVHRLDRPVSGVMVLARTSKAARRLSAAFRLRQVVAKRYIALTEAPLSPADGRLEHDLLPGRLAMAPTRVVPEGTAGAQRARLRYRTRGRNALGWVVEIELETGRKHQIRAQLSAVGAPIVGDARYGAKTMLAPGQIALAATELELKHPVKGVPMKFALPEDPPWAALDR